MEKAEIYEQQFALGIQKYKNAQSLNPKKAYRYLVEELKQEIEFLQIEKLILENRIEFSDKNSFNLIYQEEITKMGIYLECLDQISKIVKEYEKPFKRKTIENILVLKIILDLIENTYKNDKHSNYEEIEKVIKDRDSFARYNEHFIENALELRKYITQKLSEYEEFSMFIEYNITHEESPNHH